MSAYVVDPGTIDVMLSAASDHAITGLLHDVYPHRTFSDVDLSEQRSIAGRYLWCMNVRSVLYRYPSDTVDTIPGYSPDYLAGMVYQPMPAYDFAPVRLDRAEHGAVLAERSARVVLGAIHCYRYQSCELPEWDGTPADRFTLTLAYDVSSALSEGWEYVRTAA